MMGYCTDMHSTRVEVQTDTKIAELSGQILEQQRRFTVGEDLCWTTAPKCGCTSGDGRRVSFRRYDIDIPGHAEVFTCRGSQWIPTADLVRWADRPAA